MKTSTLSILLVFTLFFVGCEQAPEMEPLGEAVSLEEATPIAEILANPSAYVDKTVRIEGRVKDVCPMMGCWMEVETEDGEQARLVKVKNGVIVFKAESKGKQAVAEGEVYAIEMDHEEAIGYMEHLAEEKGEAFDPASVEGPMTVYQIRGTGALVAE